MKLVVSMIVRNEADRYQPHLAEQALQYADELRILDDGSTDGTGELLRALGPEVRLVRNRRSRWQAAGEGAARQQLLEWTLASSADYVLQLDADEFVPEGAHLRDVLGNGRRQVQDPRRFTADPAVYSLRMVEVWERSTTAWSIRVDGGWAPRQSPLLWQAPPVSMPVAEAWQRGWTVPQVRLACGREPEVVRYCDAQPTGLDVVHLGWSDPIERRKRYLRYMEVDGGKYHSNEHLRSIVETPTLQPYTPHEL